MVVKIDLSHLPVGPKSIIMNSQEFSLLTKENHYDKNDDLVCLELPQENRDEIIKILTMILSKSNIEGYSVVENMIDKNEIAILKSGDIEELRHIYLCSLRNPISKS